MIVTLDGRKLDDAFDSGTTLQGVLDQVRCGHLGDRLIVSVAVDGQRLDDARLEADLPAPLDMDVQVDLQSGDRTELVRDALRGLALEFRAAREQHTGLPDALCGGETAVAVRHIGEFVLLWQTCYRAIAQCNSLLGEDLTGREFGGVTVQAMLQDLILKLTELREGLEAHDLVLLADLLRYELLPLCETWEHVLTQLAGEVGTAAS